MIRVPILPSVLCYEVIDLDGCCGVKIVVDLFLDEDEMQALAQEERKTELPYNAVIGLRKSMAKTEKEQWVENWNSELTIWRVGQLIATTNQEMPEINKILRQTGWKKVSTTINPKTANTIYLWSYINE